MIYKGFFWAVFLCFWSLAIASPQSHNVANTALVTDDGKPSLALKGLIQGISPYLEKTDFHQAFEEAAQSEDPKNYNKLAQKYFLRKAERWDVQGTDFLEVLNPYADRILSLFQGFYALYDVDPVARTYDAILVHGARTSMLMSRIDFLTRLLTEKESVTGQSFYFLTGERDLDMELEGKDLEILKTRAKEMSVDIGSLVYESDAARLAVQTSKLPDDVKKKFHIINAPKIKKADGTEQRPNTASTISQWKKTLKEEGVNIPQSILAISSNPYVAQQHAALRHNVLEQDCTIETVGRSSYMTEADGQVSVLVKSEKSLPILLDTIARALYEDYQAYLALQKSAPQ